MGAVKWYNSLTMTIKKPTNATVAAEPVAAAGGATIADRFKLDMTDAPKKAGSTKATMIATVVGLVALAVVGILTFVIYQHWDFLQSA